MIAEVKKTYRLVENDGRSCNLTDGDGYLCDIEVLYSFDIETITVSSLHRVNKIGFCRYHMSGKYAKWFGLSYYPAD